MASSSNYSATNNNIPLQSPSLLSSCFGVGVGEFCRGGGDNDNGSGHNKEHQLSSSIPPKKRRQSSSKTKKKRQPLSSSTSSHPSPSSSSAATTTKNEPSIFQDTAKNTSSTTSSSSKTIIRTDDDLLLAKELSGLNVQERERIYEEIHGCIPLQDIQHPNDTHNDQNTTNIHMNEFIIQALLDMETELLKLRNKNAYHIALFLAPSKVKNFNFRLQFLRAEQFNTRKAAQRLVKHYEYKSILFGLDKVAKDITLADLSKNDLIALEAGSMQILSDTDNVGRSILFLSPKHSKFITWQNELRALWYQLMIAIKDRDSLQRGGLVIIWYYTGCNPQDRRPGAIDIHKNAYMIRDGIPFRVASAHFCLNNTKLHNLLGIVKTFAGREFRLRFRDHFGSHVECQYELMSFGIPRHVLPIDSFGNLCLKHFKVQFKEQQTKEIEFQQQETQLVQEQLLQYQQLQPQSQDEKDGDGGDGKKNTTTTTRFVAIATNQDVLCGRGKPYQFHPGNIRLADIIEQRQEEYNHANRQGKLSISWEIVHSISKDYGGRFLKKKAIPTTTRTKKDTDKDNDGTSTTTTAAVVMTDHEEEEEGWEQVLPAKAREKVAHGFRMPQRNQPTPPTTETPLGVGTVPPDAASTTASSPLSLSSSSTTKTTRTLPSNAVATGTSMMANRDDGLSTQHWMTQPQHHPQTNNNSSNASSSSNAVAASMPVNHNVFSLPQLWPNLFFGGGGGGGMMGGGEQQSSQQHQEPQSQRRSGPMVVEEEDEEEEDDGADNLYQYYSSTSSSTGGRGEAVPSGSFLGDDGHLNHRGHNNEIDNNGDGGAKRIKFW